MYNVEIYIYTHTHHIVLIQSSVDGYLSCFHVLTVVNSAAMNIGEHVSFSFFFFFWIHAHNEGLPSMAQMVKNLPEMQETWVRSLNWEYPLEKRMGTNCSILAWRSPQTEEPGGLQSFGVTKSQHN